MDNFINFNYNSNINSQTSADNLNFLNFSDKINKDEKNSFKEPHFYQNFYENKNIENSSNGNFDFLNTGDFLNYQELNNNNIELPKCNQKNQIDQDNNFTNDSYNENYFFNQDNNFTPKNLNNHKNKKLLEITNNNENFFCLDFSQNELSQSQNNFKFLKLRAHNENSDKKFIENSIGNTSMNQKVSYAQENQLKMQSLPENNIRNHANSVLVNHEQKRNNQNNKVTNLTNIQHESKNLYYESQDDFLEQMKNDQKINFQNITKNFAIKNNKNIFTDTQENINNNHLIVDYNSPQYFCNENINNNLPKNLEKNNKFVNQKNLIINNQKNTSNVTIIPQKFDKINEELETLDNEIFTNLTFKKRNQFDTFSQHQELNEIMKQEEIEEVSKKLNLITKQIKIDRNLEKNSHYHTNNQVNKTSFNSINKINDFLQNFDKNKDFLNSHNENFYSMNIPFNQENLPEKFNIKIQEKSNPSKNPEKNETIDNIINNKNKITEKISNENYNIILKENLNPIQIKKNEYEKNNPDLELLKKNLEVRINTNQTNSDQNKRNFNLNNSEKIEKFLNTNSKKSIDQFPEIQKHDIDNLNKQIIQNHSSNKNESEINKNQNFVNLENKDIYLNSRFNNTMPNLEFLKKNVKKRKLYDFASEEKKYSFENISSTIDSYDYNCINNMFNDKKNYVKFSNKIFVSFEKLFHSTENFKIKFKSYLQAYFLNYLKELELYNTFVSYLKENDKMNIGMFDQKIQKLLKKYNQNN